MSKFLRLGDDGVLKPLGEDPRDVCQCGHPKFQHWSMMVGACKVCTCTAYKPRAAEATFLDGLDAKLKLTEGSSSEDDSHEHGSEGSEKDKPGTVVAASPASDSSGDSGSESGSESGSGSSEQGSSEGEVNGKQFMEVCRRIFDNGTTIVAVTKHLAKTARHYGADENPEVVKAVHELLKMSSTVAYNLSQLNSKLDKYVKKE